MLTDNLAAPLILIVEDDTNHAELITRSLDDAAEKYRIQIATTVTDAKAFIESCARPQFVLSDYKLTDGYGSDLIAAVAEKCPIILMTSHGNEQVAVSAMKTGAFDYMVKSLDSFDNLPRTVNNALTIWALKVANKEMTDAALKAKKDWERTFDAVPDLISIIDSNHTVLRVNKAMADRCRLSKDQIVGKKCHEVVHGLADVPCSCPSIDLLQDGLVHRTELEEKRLGGIFEVTVSPLHDEDGRITSYVHIVRDITERNKREQLVRQRIALRDIALTSSIKELIQSTLDICEKLTDSSIGFFHLVDEEQKHLTLQAWSSNTLATMCTVEGHGKHYSIEQAGVWVECFITHEPVIHNDYATLPNRKGLPPGHATIIRELTVPVIIDGKVVSIIGVGNKKLPYTEHDTYIVKQFVTFAIEVIGRKKATIALQESEEKHRKLANELQVILDTSSAGVTFLKNRKILWANKMFDKIFGYEPGSTEGFDLLKFYPDMESYMEVGEKGYAAIEFGGIYSQDLLMKRMDGSLFWCNIVGQAVTPGNLDDGSIWIHLDISERKNAELERQKIEQQFQQTQKLESLGVLAGGIAHDFNNILTIILGHCYMVKEDIDPNMSDKAHVAKIEGAANRAADLCRQMLTYAGNSPMENVHINLWLLIDETVKMLESAIRKNVAIKLDLSRDVPEISGDNAQMQQVVMNLIINAAEAIGDRNGVIKIALTKTVFQKGEEERDVMDTVIQVGSYACLEVSDSGCGMNEEVKKRIFEPFFTTKFTGRGLGMSAILGIIRSHKGALQLSSTPDVGTTFKVYFPLSQKVAAFEAENADAPKIDATTSGTILLVDDEEALCAIGSTTLAAMGFTAITSTNGAEALEIYRKRSNQIDLILLDLVMPVMGGVEAYHELRKIDEKVPILFCSGYGAEAIPPDIAADKNVGAIKKPYKTGELRNLIQKMMV